MTFTPYVEFEQGEYRGHHIKRVGCMKCNDTIASKDAITNGLYFWDHKRDVKVTLSNGSVAHIPVCAPCSTTITNEDLLLFENTMKHGWMLEEAWVLKQFPQHKKRADVVRAGLYAKSIAILGRAPK